MTQQPESNSAEPPAQTLPASPPAIPGSALKQLGAFFSDNAWLSLFTLLLLLGLVGGLYHYSAKLVTSSLALVTSSGGTTETRSIGSSAHMGQCGQVLAIFRREATLQQLTGLMQGVDAVVVYGPNENSAFELRVNAERARAVAQALETSPLVSVASVQAECL